MKINFGKNFEKLDDYLQFYEGEYQDCIKEQNLEGKTLGEACTKNHGWMSYYAERLSELKHALSYMEIRVDEIRGKLYQGIKKGSNLSLTTNEINAYVKADPDYIDIYMRMLEVKEMVDKYAAAVDTFKHIGYALNNLTKLRVSQLEDQEL